MSYKNGTGAAYPDKSKVRKKMTPKERIKALEEDQTLTDIRVDDIVEKLQHLHTCLAKKGKRSKKRPNGVADHAIEEASVED